MQKIPLLQVLLRLGLLGVIIALLNLAIFPHVVRTEWIRINSALESGQPGSAAISLNLIASIFPWRNDLHLAAARYALAGGDSLHGIQWMGTVDQNLHTAEDYLFLGDALQDRGDLVMAEKMWQKSLANHADPAPLERLYALHSADNDIPAITSDLQLLMKVAPNDEPKSYQLTLYLAASDPEAALDWLDAYSFSEEPFKTWSGLFKKRLQPVQEEEIPEVQYLLAGQALAEMQEWELAKTAFENALAINPDYAEAWSFLGESRQHIEPVDRERALLELQQGLNLNPNSIAVLSTLALYWQRQNDLDRAAGLYRSSADLDPDNPAWLAALGGIANANGELQNAEKYYLEATQLAPHDPQYWRLLANFYIINQIQIREKAIPAAQTAVDLNPTDPGSLDLLGQSLLLLDERLAARELFVQAIQIDPNFAPAHLHYGISNLFDGEDELAYTHLQLALNMAEDNATREQANRLLNYYFP